MATYDIVEGTTNDIKFQLLESGTPINVTGSVVTLLLEDRTGTIVPNSGVITLTDSANGKIALTPTDSTIFTASKGPYCARWQIVDGAGKTSFVPTSNRDIWNIVGQ